MAIKAVDKILYIKLKLKLIELTKELFLYDIEHSTEVHIPEELRLADLPSAYWYYDFLINYI
jgi:hypothetical protein